MRRGTYDSSTYDSPLYDQPVVEGAALVVAPPATIEAIGLVLPPRGGGSGRFNLDSGIHRERPRPRVPVHGHALLVAPPATIEARATLVFSAGGRLRVAAPAFSGRAHAEDLAGRLLSEARVAAIAAAEARLRAMIEEEDELLALSLL